MDGGFSVFTPDSATFTHFRSADHAVIDESPVTSFTRLPNGNVLVGTDGNGVLEVEHTDVSRYAIDVRQVSRMFTDSHQQVWISTLDQGLFRKRRDSMELSQFLPDDRVYQVYEDRRQQLWVATGNGLVRMQPSGQVAERLRSDNSALSDDRITSLLQSVDGVYWIGTGIGLDRGVYSPFPYHDATTMLSSEIVNAIGETRGGVIWVGTDPGIDGINPDGSRATLPGNASPVFESPVMSLLGEDNTLWVGTMDSGLWRFDLTRKTDQVFRHDPADATSLGSNGVTSILRSRTGDLWVGTYGGGLNRMMPDTPGFSRYQFNASTPDSIHSDRVMALFEDRDGRLWIGTDLGLSWYDNATDSIQRLEHVVPISTGDTTMSGRTNAAGLEGQSIWSIAEDSRGNLSIGTGSGGLYMWPSIDRDDGLVRFSAMGDRLTLPSRQIYAIREDISGDIWLSHNQGLTRLDPDSLTTRHFSRRDGLQDNEFNFGASLTASDGQLYFGGNRGLNIIPTELDLPGIDTPPVAITDIKMMNIRKAFDTSLNKIERLELSHQDYLVSLSFAVLDYRNPQGHRYKYMLEGFDRDWVDTGREPLAIYSNLPAGEYVFRIIASNRDGSFAGSSRALPITVSPPWWFSAIAKVVYGLIMICLLAFAVALLRTRTKQVALRHNELEKRILERTEDLAIAKQQAEQASQAKTDFLAVMSHEIRTPMHGMLGMTELLMKSGLTAQQQNYVVSAHQSGTALLNLINSILDISKLEAGKVSLEHLPFNLLELLDEICYLESEPAGRKGLDLNLIVSPEVPVQVIGDVDKLRQVLMNLVSNAIKFSDHGEVNISVVAREVADGRASLELVVQDTGIGMDEETQRRVFEPFVQADKSTTRKYGGTGLGLAISSQYVKQMDGTTQILSSPEKGTQFTITLSLELQAKSDLPRPFTGWTAGVLLSTENSQRMLTAHLGRLGINVKLLADVKSVIEAKNDVDVVLVDVRSLEGQEQTSLSHLANTNHGILVKPLLSDEIPDDLSPWTRLTLPVTQKNLVSAMHRLQRNQNPEDIMQVTAPRFPGRRVLVAEDVLVNQEIVREMLEMMDCSVTIAADGEQAVSAFEKAPFDVVFMDCTMPVLDGYAAAAKMRDWEAATGRPAVPIVAMTASHSVETLQLCEQAGMSEYLSKPYTFEELSEALQCCLQPTSAQPETKTDDALIETDTDAVNPAAVDTLLILARQPAGRPLQYFYDKYLEVAEKHLDEVSQAFEQADSSTMADAAHSLKSAAGFIGAQRSAELLESIEQAARQDDLVATAAMLPELQRSHKTFCRVFEKQYMTESDLHAKP